MAFGVDMEKIKGWVASADGFPKFDTAYLEKTSSGGYVTVVTFVIMSLLMFAELFRYALPPMQQHYIVDPAIGSKVALSVDVSIASDCEKIVVLQVEQTGETRIISDGIVFSDERFDENLPADWVEQVKNAKEGENFAVYQSVKGCRISGTVAVNKGAGRLMIMPLLSAMGPMGQFIGKLDDEINFSHYIHHLGFGHDYPGMTNPLDGLKQLAMAPREHFTYFLSIISTVYEDPGMFWSLGGPHYVHTNQYTLNGFKGKSDTGANDQPGLFFRYDHEALALIISRQRMSFRSFLVHLVGILGGIYTCSGLLTRAMQYVWQWCLWVVGKDDARRRAKRFDPGWSPVMRANGGEGSSAAPLIIKTAKTLDDGASSVA